MRGIAAQGRIRKLGYRAPFLAMFCVAILLPATARADTSTPAAQPAPVTVDELERLVDTLQDDGARAKLVGQLRALIAAQRGTAAEQPAGPAFFGQLSQRIDALTGEILAGVAGLIDAPRLAGWGRHPLSDPPPRPLWVEGGVSFVRVFGSSFIAEWVVRLILARLMPRLPTRRSDTRIVRASFALLGLVLDILPILAFAAVAYAALPMVLDPLTRARITLSVLVNAAVEARLILSI